MLTEAEYKQWLNGLDEWLREALPALNAWLEARRVHALRDEFARSAIGALIIQNQAYSHKSVAEAAYMLADAMMAARAQRDVATSEGAGG